MSDSSDSGSAMKLEDVREEKDLDAEFAAVFGIQQVEQPNVPEPPVEKPVMDGVKKGPWSQLLMQLAPQVLLKAPTYKVWVMKLAPEVLALLSRVEKREKIVDFGESAVQKLGAVPKPFIFFVAKPKHSPTGERIIVIIEKGGKMVMVRRQQRLTVKGRITYFLAKGDDKLHFGMSTQLFMKFKLLRSSRKLRKLILEFLAGSEIPAGQLLFQCFQEFGLRLPTFAVIKDYVFSLFMTPNMELLTQFELATWSDVEVMKHLAQAILVLFAKAHVHAHLFRCLLVTYLRRLEDYHQVFEGSSFVTSLVLGASKILAKECFREMTRKIEQALERNDEPKLYLKEILSIVGKHEMEVQFRLLTRLLWQVCRIIYGDDLEPCFYITAKFMLTIPLEWSFHSQKPELVRKMEIVRKLFTLDATVPEVEPMILPLKRAIVIKAESKFRYHKETGISPTLAEAALSNLMALFTKHATLLQQVVTYEIQEDIEPPIRFIFREIFAEVDKKNSKEPEMTLLVQLSLKKRMQWLRRHKLRDDEVHGILIPLESIQLPSKKGGDKSAAPEPQPEPPRADPEPESEPERVPEVAPKAIDEEPRHKHKHKKKADPPREDDSDDGKAKEKGGPSEPEGKEHKKKRKETDSSEEEPKKKASDSSDEAKPSKHKHKKRKEPSSSEAEKPAKKKADKVIKPEVTVSSDSEEAPKKKKRKDSDSLDEDPEPRKAESSEDEPAEVVKKHKHKRRKVIVVDED